MYKFLVTVFAVLFITATNTYAANKPVGLPESCINFLTKLDQAGWSYDWHSTARDPRQSVSASNPELKVFYYFNQRSHVNEQPVFFLNGGPLASYQSRWQALKDQVELYDKEKMYTFIMMDQRGVGCSIPNLSDDDLKSTATLVQYGSENVARDVEAIRKNLWKNKKVNIFSQSYGGNIALRYLNMYPHRVNQVDMHAPAFHRSMKDFFRDRILRQNQLLPVFFNHFKVDNLEIALTLIDEKKDELCLPETDIATRVCGRPLLDGILAGLGQGPGSSVGSFDNYQGVRDSLKLLIDGNIEEFLKKADGALGGFRSKFGLAITTIWTQEMEFETGSSKVECARAYRDLEKIHGVTVTDLALDECRMIDQIPDSLVKISVEDFTPGKNLQPLDKALKTLMKYKKIDFNLYTSELDMYSQVWHLKELIQHPQVRYTHLMDSGHRAWLYEPLIWQNVMK